MPFSEKKLCGINQEAIHKVNVAYHRQHKNFSIFVNFFKIGKI